MNPSDPFGLVGQVLDGQFRVEKLVGEGGFSAVYRGHHLGLDEPVAIKCLKLPPALGAQLVDSFVQRFRDESRILYRLSQGNLHIVRSIGAGATKAQGSSFVVPYMVLEWLEGRSMANEFSVRKTLGKNGRPLDDIVKMFATAAEALAFAHSQGVVHRDLNPGNLFLAKTPSSPHAEKMKVLDFGVAKILDDTTLNLGPRAQTMGQIRIFAPAYGSPEQFDDALGTVGPHSDVYSFALVLMEALRDRPVNDGTNLGEFATAAVDANKRPTPRSLGLDVPDAVEQVFAKATKLSPKERYANVGEMWKAFEGAVATNASKKTSNRPPATRPGIGLGPNAGGGGPLSRTMPLGSPNLNLPRPSPGLPSKTGTPAAMSTATSKLKPAGAPAAGAAPAPASGKPGAGLGPSPSSLGLAPPGSQPLPAPPARAGKSTAIGIAPPPKAVASPGIPAPPAKGTAQQLPHKSPAAPPVNMGQTVTAHASPMATAKSKKALSEPPLHEDEELPTKVGQSPLQEAMPSDPPKAMRKPADEEEEDVTRVRAPEEDLLAAAAAAAAAGTSNPPAAGKPAKPSSIPPPPDSGHTLMMPPGGGGIPIPAPAAPFAGAATPDPGPPPSPPGHALPAHAPPSGPTGNFASTLALSEATVALANSPFQAQPGTGQDSNATPYQPLQPPQPGQYPQQPMQPVQSAPFGAQPYGQQAGQPGQPAASMTPGMPAHFAQAQAPAQFQQSAFPTGSHPQPGFGNAPAQAQQGPQGQAQQGGKAPVGLIIAGAAFLVIGIGGVALFFLMGRGPSTTGDTGTSGSASVATAASTVTPPPTATPAVTTPPVVDPNQGATAQPVADTDAAAPSEDGTAAATNTAAPTNTAPTNAAPTNGAPTNAPTANPVPTPVNNNPTPTATAVTTQVATAKPVPSAPPAVDPNAWNEGAARARLAQANGVLVFCRKPDEPTGPGSASVTFSPEGNVTSVTLDAPYAGTKAGDCVAGQFKRAKVNAFQGSSQTIKHSFDVPK